MKHVRQIRKTFVRQLGRNDCGLACIRMVLKYAGYESKAASLTSVVTSRNLSLLDLRGLSGSSGLKARCVQMDLEFLSRNPTPCILHLNNGDVGDHFQVCYGMDHKHDKKRYLMGDPARGIYYLTEELLQKSWVSHAALYFEDLPDHPVKQAGSSWHLLLSRQLIPTGLLLSIPLLSIFTAILGVAWSWALQRGMYSSLAEKENHLIEGMIALLFMVTLAKNLFSFIRQQLMIRLNTAVNRHLMNGFIARLFKLKQRFGQSDDQSYFKNGVTSMMKMQQAVSAFLVTILSEGSIIVLVLAALFYQSFIFGFINACYLFIVLFYSFRTFPDLLFDHAHLNELSGSSERSILQEMAIQHHRSENDLQPAVEFHIENHALYLKYAGKVSSEMSKNSLIMDCLGTCCVICVFIYGILRLRDASLSYSAFMILVILSYFITALMPKICSALFVVIDGIQASRQYQVNSTL
jgi:ABC-type bacteriocin/lantibiotic exporter with double-glycine peptidase domain